MTTTSQARPQAREPMLMQLPAGRLVDRCGARIMFPIAVCWWSLFTP
jgi:hypothetical protein